MGSVRSNAQFDYVFIHTVTVKEIEYSPSETKKENPENTISMHKGNYVHIYFKSVIYSFNR